MPASPEMIFEGVQRLQAGAVVALPTETVYGLAALASSDDAVRSLVELRGRDDHKPLSLAVADIEMASGYIEGWPTLAGVSSRELARAHWPGPLTLVLPKKNGLRLPKWVGAGAPGIGLRCPAHSLTLALVQTLGEAVVLPSANRPGEPPATTAEQVSAIFGDSVYVIDGGPCERAVASTVVEFDDQGVRVLREGALSAAELGIA